MQGCQERSQCVEGHHSSGDQKQHSHGCVRSCMCWKVYYSCTRRQAEESRCLKLIPVWYVLLNLETCARSLTVVKLTLRHQLWYIIAGPHFWTKMSNSHSMKSLESRSKKKKKNMYIYKCCSISNCHIQTHPQSDQYERSSKKRQTVGNQHEAFILCIRMLDKPPQPRKKCLPKTHYVLQQIVWALSLQAR